MHFKRAERPPAGALPSSYDDDLHVRALLYRYKLQTTIAPNQRAGVNVSTDNRPALDNLDLALANEMISASLAPTAAVTRPRDAAAPWLYCAVGELRQIEINDSSPAKSNPCILEYLDKAELKNVVDSTPWCAALVTWVLAHAQADTAQTPPTPYSLPLPASPVAASTGLIGSLLHAGPSQT